MNVARAVPGPWLDPELFGPEAVPATTLAVTQRLRRDGARAPLAVEPPSDRAVDRMIDGPAGPLRIRVLSSGEVRACYVHLHGGGWAVGGPDRQDETLLRFASAAGVAVVAVEYRLAPQHPHPAGLADCVAAIRWLAANGERELGAGRLIVGGESAGAHLAALALLALRDRGSSRR